MRGCFTTQIVCHNVQVSQKPLPPDPGWLFYGDAAVSHQDSILEPFLVYNDSIPLKALGVAPWDQASVHLNTALWASLSSLPGPQRPAELLCVTLNCRTLAAVLQQWEPSVLGRWRQLVVEHIYLKIQDRSQL